MKFYVEKDLAICGLACVLCSEQDCPGCKARGCKNGSDCSVYQCATNKGIDGCYQCEAFPCNEKMLSGIRNRAFNRYAKQYGKQALLDRLHINFEYGITYHRPNELKGDYDICKTEQEIMDLLKNGKPNPYDTCPVYESKHFLLRLVSLEDAAQLLESYKNLSASIRSNSEYCVFGYGSQTLEEMQNSIKRWLEEYRRRSFVRFSIVNKQEGTLIGTVEIANTGWKKHSVLRIDLASAYEKREPFEELIQIADCFFLDFDCEKIVTRVPPDFMEYARALTETSYVPYPPNEEWEREDYYIKRQP